jgi:hypothetical protein
LSLGRDFLDHGEEVVEEAVPGFDFAEAGALEFGVGGVVLDDGAETVEMAGGILEVRFDAETQEAVGQMAEVEFGPKVFFAHAGQEDAFDGAELTEPFETLERAAAAGAEQDHYFVEVERTGGGEKEAVDLSGRARQGQGLGGAEKERNGLDLER